MTIRERFAYWAARVRAMVNPSAYERDLREELDAHTALLAEDYQRRGMSHEEAQRRARLELGNAVQLAEAHREARSLPLLETAVRDIRYGLRSLKRDAGFSTFAILMVTLGIAASATVASVVGALWLRPLPVRDSADLAWVQVASENQQGDLSSETLKVNPYVEYREQNRSFSDVAAYFAFYGIKDRKMVGTGEPERLTAVPVTQNFFPLLGITPRLGRTFSEGESRDSLPVVVLSEGFWKRRFGGSESDIIGRELTINDRAMTVIGVVPFDFGALFAPGTAVDLYVPLPLSAALNRSGNTLSAVGRLRPGVTMAQAQAEADVLTPPIGERHDRDGLRLRMQPLEERVRGQIRPALLLLSGAVLAVMLIVCANLSNLQLARAAARQRELAIRVALGAGRGRLISQLLTESLLLSGMAAALGIAMAGAATRGIASLETLSIPLRSSINLDPVAAGLAVAAAVLLGLVSGLAPLLRAPSRAVHAELKESGRGTTMGGRLAWARSALVVSEIAFSCVLLIGAGLLLRSLWRVMDVNLGFRPEQAASMRIDVRGNGENRFAPLDEALRRVRELPGISAAGVTDVLPLGGNRSWSASAKGKAYSRSNPPPDAFVRIVSDGYCGAMGIPLVAGRDIGEHDGKDAKRVIVINETLARLLWPGEDAIGKVLRADGEREVVGVVRDVRHIALEQESGAEMYLPVRQTQDYASMHLVVRGTLPAATMAAAVRNTLLPLDPSIPANEFVQLRQLVDRSISPRRFVASLLAGFAAFALVLAGLGIYAVIAYAVGQQRQEIGIRMALGASGGEIQARVLRRTLLLASVGVGTGALVAWVLSGLVAVLLYGVTTADPFTYAVTVAMVLGTALLAGYLPARQASQTDPMVALRDG
jgi:predicted permease